MTSNDFSPGMISVLIVMNGAFLVAVSFILVLFGCKGIYFFGGINQCIRSHLSASALIVFILAILFVATSLVIDTLDYFTDDINSSNKRSTIGYIVTSSFILLYVLVYVAMISRVHSTFQNSVTYAVSKGTIYFLVFVCVTCAFIVLCVLFFNKEGSSMITVVIIGFVDILLNVAVLRIFMTRLYKMIEELNESFHSLIIEMSSINLNEQSVSINTKAIKKINYEIIDEKLNKNHMDQNQIVDLMIKISSLTIICVIFQHVWIWFSIYCYIQGQGDGEYYVLYLIAIILRHIGVLVNCCALYLTFAFNEDQYMRFCGLCHRCMKDCCVRYIGRRRYKQRQTKMSKKSTTSNYAQL